MQGYGVNKWKHRNLYPDLPDSKEHAVRSCCRLEKNRYLKVSCLVVSDSLEPQGLQDARLSCPSLSPGVCSHSYPLSRWCHPAISSSVSPFYWLQSFPGSGSFPVSWLFASGGIGASAAMWKDVQRCWLLEKCKSKLQWDITSYQPQWLSSKNPQTRNVGEGVERRERSCTVSRNVNWYSHSG